jgi:clan AA aspartic protease (TIGR02281 family)
MAVAAMAQLSGRIVNPRLGDTQAMQLRVSPEFGQPHLLTLPKRRCLLMGGKRHGGGMKLPVVSAVLRCSAAVGAVILAACSQPGQQASASSQAPASAQSSQVVAASSAITTIHQRGTAGLEEDGGTYVLPVLINNTITLKFTIDSGASDVSIPADVAHTLVRSGTITSDDFIGTQTFTLADGSTVPSPLFRIRSLKVGDIELQNVVATITNENGSLLLGQSFLSRLSSWSIDNDRHVLLMNENPNAAQVPLSPPSPTEAASLPDPSAEAAASAAQPLTDTSQAQNAARSQTMAYFSSWSGTDAESAAGVRQYFAPAVNFYGTMTDINSLMAAKLKYSARWPIRNYTIRDPSLQISCSDSQTCVVQGITDWDDSDPLSGRRSVGVSSFILGLQDNLIVSENGKTLSRHSNFGR